MKISSLGINQSFGARKSKGDNDTFKLMNDFSAVLSDTSNKTAQLADVMVAVNSAIGSPEEATIKVVNDKLDDFASNEKNPNWIKKPAKYIGTVLVTGFTAYAASKTLKAPSAILKTMKKHLSKVNSINNIMNYVSKIKGNVFEAIESLKLTDKKLYKTVSGFLSARAASVNKFIQQKTPKFLKQITKIDKWGKKDYVRNSLAALIGLSSGRKFLNKHSMQKTQVDDYEEEVSLREAA